MEYICHHFLHNDVVQLCSWRCRFSYHLVTDGTDLDRHTHSWSVFSCQQMYQEMVSLISWGRWGTSENSHHYCFRRDWCMATVSESDIYVHHMDGGLCSESLSNLHLLDKFTKSWVPILSYLVQQALKMAHVIMQVFYECEIFWIAIQKENLEKS